MRVSFLMSDASAKTLRSHGASPEHINHIKPAFLAPLTDLLCEESARINSPLRVRRPPLHIVSNLELDLSVSTLKGVRVVGMPRDGTLRHRRYTAVRHAAARELGGGGGYGG